MPGLAMSRSIGDEVLAVFVCVCVSVCVCVCVCVFFWGGWFHCVCVVFLLGRGRWGRTFVPELSSADHSVSPPAITVPRDYNAAHDLIERNLRAGRAKKLAYIDDATSCTYGELAERVHRCEVRSTLLPMAK